MKYYEQRNYTFKLSLTLYKYIIRAEALRYPINVIVDCIDIDIFPLHNIPFKQFGFIHPYLMP